MKKSTTPKLTELESAVLTVMRLIVPQPAPPDYNTPTVAIPPNSFHRVAKRMAKAQVEGTLTIYQVAEALSKLGIAYADLAVLVLPRNAHKLAAFNLWLDAAIERWSQPVPQPPASGSVQPIPVPRDAP